MSNNKEQGQILLIIILVLAVSLTVGLSFISRSITSIRTTREEASSQKALSAAEAGIEEILKANTAVILSEPSFAQNTSYEAISTFVTGTQFLIQGGNIVAKDEGADIWLVSHDADGSPNYSTPWSGNITIYWGTSSDVCDPLPANNTMAALEVMVISGSQAAPITRRYVFDPCTLGRRSNNNFSPSSPGGIVGTRSFAFSAPLPLITNGLVVRAIPIYARSAFGVIASAALPSQGLNIDSTGDSGGTQRKINVFKGYPQLPVQYFSYGLFSL